MENDNKNPLEPYRTPYLFLLIGTNPLPNYVAAQLLWAREKKDAKLYFVYTKDTEKYVNTLKAELGLKVYEELILIDVKDESNTKKIYDGVHEEVQKLKNEGVDDDKIGLNYTGGTKTMAVHAYRAIRELAEGTCKTYLDARSLEMVIERKSEKDDRVPTRDLLEMNIDTFLALHQYEYLKPQGKPKKPKCVNELISPELAQAIVDKDLRQAIRDWAYFQYRVGIVDNDKLTKSAKKNAKSTLKLPMLDGLKDYYEGCDTVGQFSEKKGSTPTDVCTFFEGKWLEEYVLLALSDFKPKPYKYSCGANVNSKSLDGVDFEVDDFAINGYQLFAISCKTNNEREKLKLGLFEVFVRARQIGGDEARFALVCNIDDASSLQNELTRDWNLPEGIVRVFGYKEISKLSEGLGNWINN